MWGLSESGTPEATLFWAAFWPALWSGAIYSIICGLVTGLVVGILLLRFQRGAEGRAAARGYARELSLKLDQIRTALSQKDVTTITSAQRAIPPAAVSCLECLKDAPLSIWAESIPEHRAIINAALSLQKCCALFHGIALQVDHELQQRVRAYNHASGVSQGLDSAYRQFVLGRMLGANSEDILPWVSATGPKTLEDYDNAWRDLAKSREITVLARQIKQSREAVMGAMHALWLAIEEPN